MRHFRGYVGFIEHEFGSLRTIRYDLRRLGRIAVSTSSGNGRTAREPEWAPGAAWRLHDEAYWASGPFRRLRLRAVGR